MVLILIKEYGYEYDATIDKKLWVKSKGKVTYDKLWGALCLRSGRDAFKVIAKEYKPSKVLMPALACESMILPFKMNGHNICYYRLKETYSIDLDYFRGQIEKGEQKIIFLYMDYFGIPAIKDTELEKLRFEYPNMIFVEDRTHNLILEKKRKFVPEYTVASLRKWINVPDGGLLWTDLPIEKNVLKKDTSFSELRMKAQCMRNSYFKQEDDSIKSEYRKIFSTVSDIIDKDADASRMSMYAYELAKHTNWDKLKKQREKNFNQLVKILKEKNINIIQNSAECSSLYVPFLVYKRDSKQMALSSLGIFNTIIWPLSYEQKEVCSVAKYTEEHMLAAPCDQRYTEEDMIYIGEKIVRFINE